MADYILRHGVLHGTSFLSHPAWVGVGVATWCRNRCRWSEKVKEICLKAEREKAWPQCAFIIDVISVDERDERLFYFHLFLFYVGPLTSLLSEILTPYPSFFLLAVYLFIFCLLHTALLCTTVVLSSNDLKPNFQSAKIT